MAAAPQAINPIDHESESKHDVPPWVTCPIHQERFQTTTTLRVVSDRHPSSALPRIGILDKPMFVPGQLCPALAHRKSSQPSSHYITCQVIVVPNYRPYQPKRARAHCGRKHNRYEIMTENNQTWCETSKYPKYTLLHHAENRLRRMISPKD